jgi:uncharacterized protein (TIGR02646 family)
MIYVDRSTVPSPGIFRSARLRAQIGEAEKFYATPPQLRGQRDYSWTATVRLLRSGADNALKQLFRGKCAYCESLIDRLAPYSLGHFRPRAMALGTDGSVAADHYWWLAFEWSNLLPACQPCNTAKASRFPVRGKRASPGERGNALTSEQPLLLDPCIDDAEKHLIFTIDGIVSSDTAEGQTSIETLALNRQALVAQRALHLARLTNVIGLLQESQAGRSLALHELREAVSPHSEFTAATRQLVRQHWQKLDTSLAASERRTLGKLGRLSATTVSRIKGRMLVHVEQRAHFSVETSSTAAREAYFRGARRIETIEIGNFKSIRHLRLTMPVQQGREPWLMLVGENATGKSSILQAIALTLLGQSHLKQLQLDAREFVTHGADAGSVRVTLTNLRSPVELHFSHHQRHFRCTPRPPLVLVLGYGATRILPRSRSRTQPYERYVRVKNLFNPHARLHNAEGWLADPARVSDAQFDSAARALKRLLMLSEDDTILREKRRLFASLDGERFSLAELSDGYQSIVALATDVMMGVSGTWSDMRLAEGVVLVDEIETHLHPTWKMEVVSRFRESFPKLQFICSTHDPLCLRGLDSEEILVLKRDGAELRADRVTQPIGHLRADQLLTSPLFGLVSTRAPAFVRDTERYAELLALQDRTEIEEQEFSELRTRLQEGLLAGETEDERNRERLMRHQLMKLNMRDQDPPDNPPPTTADITGELTAALDQILGDRT